MNISILSSNACMDIVSKVLNIKYLNNHTIYKDRPIKNFSVDSLIGSNLVIAQEIPVFKSKEIKSFLHQNNISYLWPEDFFIKYETDRILTKQMLKHLNIPTTNAFETTGNWLSINFWSLPRPFVIKINKYLHGRQTIIVDDNNADETYYNLFSRRLDGLDNILNIDLDTKIVIEEYIEIEQEYSFHVLMNNINWQYCGSAVDYKKRYEGNLGPNIDSAGCYTIWNVDARIHEYADKIHQYLKTYKGFMFLGIAIDKQGTPVVLEINTRYGDPELSVACQTTTDSFVDAMLSAVKEATIPPIIHNDKTALSVCLLNNNIDWTASATDLPVLKHTQNIIIGKERLDNYYSRYGIVSACTDTLTDCRKIVYDYLDNQYIGQYYYRKDIGL